MTRRILIGVLAVLLAATSLQAAGKKAYKPSGFTGGVGLSRGLILEHPYDDVSSPLKSYIGAESTFSRAHDATHTATYVHPGTGLVTVADNNQLRIETLGALFEAARTNVLTYSEQFNNIAWTAGAANLTITPNAAVAPDGTQTADLVVLDNGVAAGPVGYFNYTTSLTAPFSTSVYLKAAGRINFVVQDGSGAGAAFDLSAGTATPFGGALVSASITALPNGWYRCKVTCDTGTPANPHFFSYFNVGTGDGVSGMYFWGAQMEAGASVSSYIPTVAAAMTRNADALTLPAIGSPGTAIATVDGTNAEITYSGYDPTGHHVKNLMLWDRTLTAAEISALTQ